MPIKLIAIDVDGTLVNAQKQIEEEVVQTVKEVTAQGIKIAVCTGRSPRETVEVVEGLRELRYGITANGAYVLDFSSDQIVYQDPLLMDDVRTIYNCLREFDMMFELYTSEQVLVDQRCLKDLDRYGVGDLTELVRNTRSGIEDFSSYIKERTEPIGKINIFFNTPDDREAAKKRAGDLPFYMTHQEPTNLEFTKKGVDKGRGLEELAALLEIHRQEIMAIGDNNNDIPMLKYAGVSVAMGNAIDEIKEMADFVTKSNVEKGVAYAIQQMVIKKQKL